VEQAVILSEACMSARHTVLVTGASSGIGVELARLFASDGSRVILLARRADRLVELASEISGRPGQAAETLVADLADPAAPAAICQELGKRGLQVDVLVNNAGFGAYGPFAEADPAETLRLLQVNITSLTLLTRLLLPGMISRRFGRILNIASTAGFQPGPLMAVYYASKAYVVSWSQALANELAETGVTVTALCPGPTRTEFQERAGMAHTRLMRSRIMSASAAAEAGYRGLLAGKPVVIPGFRNKLLASLARWLPPTMVVRMVRAIQEGRTT
jgi:short-subunit dehydrogenase